MISRNALLPFFAFSALARSNPLVSSSLSASDLLDRALSALGGKEAIAGLTGVTYHSPNIFRSRSLMQSYELAQPDASVAIRGHQNISFSFTSNELTQRIDRVLTPSNYWTWSSPALEPFDFSLVVRGGNDGFACFVRGNNQIWLPPNVASGYTDSALAEYLVLHGEMLSPKLPLIMQSSNGTSSQSVQVNGIQMPAVRDSWLDVTLILNASTYLPYIVRTTEDHYIYGPSTNDLYLSDYKAVDGIMFPHQIQTVYNATSTKLNAPLEDYIIEDVTTNPKFPNRFFDGMPANESFTPRAPPKKIGGITHARITEFSSNGLWSGISNSTVDDLEVQQPLPQLPSIHWVIVDNDTLGVKQLILEFENEVIVGDAPPQWTANVITWIQENLKKPITHLWPTHHHRDHTGGAAMYVALGAKLIVPEMAAGYWSSIPNATFVTFNDTHPYVHADSNMQAWFMWQPSATHASDWSYSMITPPCISDNSTVALFETDAWQAGMPREQSDQAEMHRWLDQLLSDGVTDQAIVLPTHGLVTPLSELIDIAGYPYPPVSPTNWRYSNNHASW